VQRGDPGAQWRQGTTRVRTGWAQLFAHFRWGEHSVDTSGLPGSAGSGSEGAPEEGAPVVGRWPDGTAITESQWRAPDDPRELIGDLRGYLRENRRHYRRRTFGHAMRTLGSPRGAVAIMLVAALVASAFAMLMPALK
jgi:hypothetical protein